MRSKLLLTLALCLGSLLVQADSLSSQFAHPPASARPWVYWFWNNGNVTKAGITADLEAMKRVGIGGVIIMDVVERFAPPAGSADFMNAEWQELFKHAVTEAHRLGIEINMTNGPGWCGSSGKWITPEFSMQKLISTNLVVDGPTNFAGKVPHAELPKHRETSVFDSLVDFSGFYRDVAVLAYPVNPDGVVMPGSVQDLTRRISAEGKLEWNVPAGRWIIQRIGHTSTGSSTRPPVKGGNGLECDKLNAQAMDLHFTNLMGKLIQAAGQMAGPTLSATHIDSWEVGTQNWTPRFPEEFRKRRGYDPLPFLPNIIAANLPESSRLTIGEESIHRRFRWDFQQTVSELLAESYVGRLAMLAHQHGMRLTIEGYNLPFGDEATYTQRADEPMSEFWATGGNENEAKSRQMASVAHVMGQRIVGAEAFTAGDNEQWKMHPATVKALGDYQFSQGINRFVIHRYAHQPYLDRYPGATMGPWGLHYERTQTWWEMSGPWHQYLARCQFLLRQGLFVADLLYLRPEQPDQTYFRPEPPPPTGYKYDEISAEALIQRAKVKNNRLVLPDGMSYRLLILPATTRTMTPGLINKLKDLLSAGAVILGPAPVSSPSLSAYPKCDQDVQRLSADVWGPCDGKTVAKRVFGKGTLYWGEPLESILRASSASPDFLANQKLNWIHRRAADTEIYFVANERSISVEVTCHFRVKGLRPELWDPQTGEMSPLVQFTESEAGISIPLRLEASGSVFVVFRVPSKKYDPITQLTWNDQPVVPLEKRPQIHVRQASYGVPGDAARNRDVAERIRKLTDEGTTEFTVRALAEGDDPAYGIVKTLDLSYSVGDRQFRITARDPDQVSLDSSIVFSAGSDGDGGLKGEYFPNPDLSGPPAVTRIDTGINFSWNNQPPAPGLPIHDWSARWTGTITTSLSGEYTFSLHADDGCRLFINDRKLIDHWVLDDGSEPCNGKINLVAGENYSFRVEYYQGPGDAGIRLGWARPADERSAELTCDSSGKVKLIATMPGSFEFTTAKGKSGHLEVTNVPAPEEIGGAWEVFFSTNWGAPGHTTLAQLSSLTESTIPGVKYFSGTATYRKQFEWRPPALGRNTSLRTWLDLGEVEVMARVKLNGQDLGVVWKSPFRVDVTGQMKPGLNKLEITVANLWPNRMIGDAALPREQRLTWSSFEPFTAESALPKSGLLGPIILHYAETLTLPLRL